MVSKSRTAFGAIDNFARMRLVQTIGPLALARHPSPALASRRICSPREVGMVFAYPTGTAAIGTVGLYHYVRSRCTAEHSLQRTYRSSYGSA